MTHSPRHLDLKYIAAPMVNQSDLPFRLLVSKHGATTTYTQMLFPHKLINDIDYRGFHLRDLQTFNSATASSNTGGGLVVQLCGNDPGSLSDAAKIVSPWCDALDLNLGCPQDHARHELFGAYLLDKQHWPLLSQIIASLSSGTLPVSAKLRLCNPPSLTSQLALSLQEAGASWITLHPRTVSARKRRCGPAHLDQVKLLKDTLTIPVISNGNVRSYDDLAANLAFTGADGLMVGETLLGDPSLFSGTPKDPVSLALEYLDLCSQYPETYKLEHVKAHLRHIIEFRYERETWYYNFRDRLASCSSVDDLWELMEIKVDRWRGGGSEHEDSDQDETQDFELGETCFP